jgi:drug/metabolite transporter (DMT)-like permease
VLRFLLGACEAGFFPGAILFLSLWFPDRHRAGVTGLFYIATPLAFIFGSPISGLLLGIDGVGGLFGYHALYFAALRLAPPAEAGLINYLWPLLIVLFSALLPGERLRAAHVVGALLGFAGLVALASGGLVLDPGAAPGYACAFVAAFVWAGYSVLSRRFGAVPTDAVAGFCLATAALSLAAHLAFETTVWPNTAGQWAAVAALGLGPVGAAFYLWDIGVKRGDIRLLGTASYATPVASTLVLVLAGYAEPTPALALACVLIAAGALVATWPGRRTAPA